MTLFSIATRFDPPAVDFGSLAVQAAAWLAGFAVVSLWKMYRSTP